MRERPVIIAVLLLVAAAACSDEEPSSAGTDEVAPEAPVTQDEATDDPAEPDAAPDPVLRLAYDLVSESGGGFKWDPSQNRGNLGPIGLYHWVYGGLMRPAPDGSLVPDLAKSATIVDPNTIDIELRNGLTLSDGSPFDAELVKEALERNLAQAAELPAYGADFTNLESVEVTAPTSLRLTIPNGTASSWYDAFLGGQETVIVPPGTNFDAPEGAGPFRVTEFVPEERAVLEKNPDYWDADSIEVARIELVNAPDPQTAAAALNAGQVDWAGLDIGVIDAVASTFEVQTSPDPSRLTSFPICKDVEPFDDPRVRQALSMTIDREAINEALFDAAGEPAWDLWPEDHRLHNPELTGRYEYDPEAAQELLDDAGYPDGFTVDVIPLPSAGMPELAEVVQQQFAQIGVTMDIQLSSNFVEDVYISKQAPMTLVPVMAPGIGKFDQWVGESVGNMCGYDDPELDELVDDVASVSSESDDAVGPWHAAQERVVDEALSLLVVFQPNVSAYDADRLGGVATAPYTILVPEIRDIDIKE